MFPRALRIGSVAGVAIRVDPSWIVIALLVGLSFWGRFAQAYGRPTGVAAAQALAATLLFFGSVLAHELGHALEALHRGVSVSGITLFLFGGVTETRFDVRRPFDEFALSAVGPYVSFVLAAAFGLVATGADTVGLATVAEVTGLLAWLNAALGVFNLLPGAPLDGGRVLRAIIWKVSGDRRTAIRGASRAGQALGGLIGGFGLWQLLVFGDLANGIWFAFIGWFLLRAATAELDHGDERGVLAGRTVGDICDPPEWVLPADGTVAEVVADVTRSPADVHAVGFDEDVVGVVGLDDLAAVPRERRASTYVADVMRPIRRVETVQADDSIEEALARVHGSRVLVVLDDTGDLAGLLTERELERAVERLRRLHDGDLHGRPPAHLPSDEAPR